MTERGSSARPEDAPPVAVDRLEEALARIEKAQNIFDALSVSLTLAQSKHAFNVARADVLAAVGEARAEVARLRRAGFDEGLVWVRERFNLDSEDVDALNDALENGAWE